MYLGKAYARGEFSGFEMPDIFVPYYTQMCNTTYNLGENKWKP